jgi:IS605 OrfB family transposase
MKGLPFVCGERQRELLRGQRGESDLILFNGSFYLFATCDVEEPEPNEVLDVLGVDLGIANIAVDSDGQVRSGSQIKSVRYRHRRLRQKLQVKGTKSSRRRLKRLSGKEARFAKDTNHCISKQLVQTAKDTGRALAIENLNGIRDRGTVRRSQRVHLQSWSFYQLRQFLTYKARKAGVVLVAVDPRNSSRTCPACGYIDKRNRSAQATFSCLSCGFAGLADYIAAVNLRERGRAAVNLPNVSDAALSVCHAVVPGTSCLL